MANSGSPLSSLASVVSGCLDGSVVSGEIRIIDVTHDSRLANGGTLFVAIRGLEVDGHIFVRDAVGRGATAVCVDQRLEANVPQLVVQDTRLALGPLAASVHENPSRDMIVVGVTGTNGKTTVTHYVESLAGSAGVATGLIGTIHTRIGNVTLPAVHTTPEASDFQRLLARMRDSGASLVAAEVSSHALELGRVNATRFAVAGFTNFSQDHLDFHGDMDRYLSAKRRLFEDYDIGTAVVNIDDPAGAQIAESFNGNLLTVGQKGHCRHSGVRTTVEGTTFTLDTPWGSASLSVPVIGRFNLDNAVLAAACSLAAGIDFNDVIAGLPGLAGVPGRYEIVSGEDPITVIVDYAHTPDGVAVAIRAARELHGKRVIVVLGAGGDRDREKRSLMGEAASSADIVVITSDNPRSEEPEDIVASVVAGLNPSVASITEVDRHRAIQQAVSAAADGDIVLVLGRGHEPDQDINGEQIPFDDREVAREALQQHRRSADLDTDSGSIGR